jgi:hypothetical protein
MVEAFSDGGYEQGARSGVQAVPEPNYLAIWMLLPAASKRSGRRVSAFE